jgi:hypothetical protein
MSQKKMPPSNTAPPWSRWHLCGPVCWTAASTDVTPRTINPAVATLAKIRLRRVTISSAIDAKFQNRSAK